MKVYNLFTEHCTHQGEGGRKTHLSMDGVRPLCGTPSAWKDNGYSRSDEWELTLEKLIGNGYIECDRCRELVRKKLEVKDYDRNYHEY